jgi:hypothetical protein
LYSGGRVDFILDPILLIKSDSAGNKTRTPGSVAKVSDHYTIDAVLEGIYHDLAYGNIQRFVYGRVEETARILFFFFFIYNLNQQSEFTFYKLMLLLLQCLDGESSSGEYPVPKIRPIGQFVLSRLFFSLTSSVLRSGFSWVSSVV